MQQSTDKQLDDKISGKIDQNVSKTVRTILSTDLTPNAFKANKKSKKTKNISHSTDGGAKAASPEKEDENADESKQKAIPVQSQNPVVTPQFNFCLNKLLWTLMDNSSFLCRSTKGNYNRCRMLKYLVLYSTQGETNLEGSYADAEGVDVSDGDLRDTQVFLMLIVWILHLLTFLKIK